MVDDEASQSQDELSGIGASRAGLGAHAAVQTAPELVRVLENLVTGSQLRVADHFPGEVLVVQWANGRTGATVEALEGGVHPEVLQFIGELRVNQSHCSSFPERSNCRSYCPALSSL
jgi:hypothetical protein